MRLNILLSEQDIYSIPFYMCLFHTTCLRKYGLHKYDHQVQCITIGQLERILVDRMKKTRDFLEILRQQISSLCLRLLISCCDMRPYDN
jgi:hypothetical protein